MSDDVLSVIPTDPQWQPDQAAADRTVAIVAELALRLRTLRDRHLEP